MAVVAAVIALGIIAISAVLLHGMVKRNRNTEEFPSDAFIMWMWRNQK